MQILQQNVRGKQGMKIFPLDPAAAAQQAGICGHHSIRLRPLLPWHHWNSIIKRQKSCHQAISAKASGGMTKDTDSAVVRKKFSNREINTPPGRTQAATNCNLPNKDCSSCLVDLVFLAHWAKSDWISNRRSGVMVRVKFLVSNCTPKKVMTEAGGQALSAASVRPARDNTRPRASKACGTSDQVAAPPKSSK